MVWPMNEMATSILHFCSMALMLNNDEQSDIVFAPDDRSDMTDCLTGFVKSHHHFRKCCRPINFRTIIVGLLSMKYV